MRPWLQPRKTILILEEVGAYLSVGVELAEELVESGELAVFRSGRVARVLVDDLVAFLEVHRSPAFNTEEEDR